MLDVCIETHTISLRIGFGESNAASLFVSNNVLYHGTHMCHPAVPGKPEQGLIFIVSHHQPDTHANKDQISYGLDCKLISNAW
jgi:hypothetical protein